MSRHDPYVKLEQMREHAAEAIALAADRSRLDLDNDRMLMHALTRVVEIVGEAASRVPRDIQDEHPGIPWVDVVGMRHRLIHGYDAVDLDILWVTIQDDLPVLVDQLDRILKS